MESNTDETQGFVVTNPSSGTIVHYQDTPQVVRLHITSPESTESPQPENP